MTSRKAMAVLFGLVIFARGVSAQPERKQKKPKETKESTQTLEIPKEPPLVIAADTGKLVFHISPLSAKGLLSQQVRDALKALDKANGGATLVKLRAFVAGAGDLRRVAAIVSEEFSDKKLPIPAVSTIQVGALPLDGAQVVIESVSADKKTVNPAGLAFFGAQSVIQLRAAAQAADASILKVTCFLSSLDELQAARTEVAAAFPTAAANFVQLTRVSAQQPATCEAVGRLAKPPGDPIHGAAFVARPKLIFTGLQIAFRDQDSDIRLAFDRMSKALESQGISYRDVVFTNVYALNRSVAAKTSAIRSDFVKGGPEGTAQIFEGLPSLDATMAFEVVAAK